MSNRFAQSLAALEANEVQPPAQSSGSESKLLSSVIAKMPPKKSKGLSRTYYLSKEVANAVERKAKQRGIYPSNLVDAVLKQVLLVEQVEN